MKRLLVLCSSVLVCASACSSYRSEDLLARVRGEVDGETYQVDVVKKWKEIEEEDKAVRVSDPRHKEKHPGSFLFRELTIRCVEGCADDVSYTEETIDGVISVFWFDGGRDFVTLWASGSAYIVKIYHVEGGRISKVMEAGSKGAPKFDWNKDGTSIVRLNDPYSRDSIWKWDGSRYSEQATDR